MPYATSETADILPASTEIDNTFWVRAAQKRVREHCRWHVAPVMRLIGRINHRGGLILRLPALSIHGLTSLTYDGMDITAQIRLDPATGLVELPRPLPAMIAGISYDMTAGYEPDDVPDVQQVILQAARRAASTPAGIVKSQSVNGSNVSYDMAGGGAAAVTLLAAEIETLDPYRLGWLP